MSSGAAVLLTGSMLSLLCAALLPSIVRQPLLAAGFLRLARLMNAARFAAAFIFFLMIVHGARVVRFVLHSGVHLLPFKWDGVAALRVAIYLRAV